MQEEEAYATQIEVSSMCMFVREEGGEFLDQKISPSPSRG
jgi:hypothetical protein